MVSITLVKLAGISLSHDKYLHPQDKNPDNRAAAEAKFKEISEAYEVRFAPRNTSLILQTSEALNV